ncbi:hypothetical protein [Actinomycetospora lemnae]|uniref:Uncharacterized protein n=1 Tax=Actinomycetospora lemnae TaxID=3019891 RepID=A0ABT5ST44_9PSEU|nr:hypothetical protein [Actinomycetospora sp. DW7H6]MDD7966008.1 hypothetical protein [Actinomycetospora sp. DW7H6]
MFRRRRQARVAIRAIRGGFLPHRRAPRLVAGDDQGERVVMPGGERMLAPAVSQQRVAVRHDRGGEGLRVRLGTRRGFAGHVLDRAPQHVGQPRELVEHVRGPGEVIDAVGPQRPSFVVEATERLDGLPGERDACVLNRHDLAVPARRAGDAPDRRSGVGRRKRWAGPHC